jgi:hypothetical protein
MYGENATLREYLQRFIQKILKKVKETYFK